MIKVKFDVNDDLKYLHYIIILIYKVSISNLQLVNCKCVDTILGFLNCCFIFLFGDRLAFNGNLASWLELMRSKMEHTCLKETCDYDSVRINILTLYGSMDILGLL